MAYRYWSNVPMQTCAKQIVQSFRSTAKIGTGYRNEPLRAVLGVA